MRRHTALAALWLGLALCPAVHAQTVGTTLQTDQVRAELLAHAPQGIQAGQTFWLGLQLQHQPHWHTYWQNPGDSGLPTRLQWKLPAGLQASEIAWPLPKKIPIGSLANYGYEGTVLLPVAVTVGPEFKAPIVGTVKIELQAEWLVCRQECIPQEGAFAVSLPAQGATALHGALFEAAQKQVPPTRQGAHSARVSSDGRTLTLNIDALPSSWRGQSLSLYPVTANVVNNAAIQDKTWTQSWQGGRWTAQMPVSDERSDSPSAMRWVIAMGPERSPRLPAFEVDTPVQGTWPQLAPTSASVSPALAKALEENTKTAAPTPAPSDVGLGSLVLAWLGAFLGGLLLNLMPCVFPVLAIKVLGFAQPGHGQAEHRAAGLAYTAGVVLSFLLLGGLLLGLRAAGEQLGWGFQLQSPPVVAGLALLFTLLGLNLAGVFEFGQMVPSGLAGWQSRHATVNAGLSGVLAVAVASPCTAPFMGTSLGLAIALPTAHALAVFVAMGLGMALPYLAASFWPAVANALPRPGAWMVVFRQALAFPMFATVIWLLWVLGQQTNIDAASGLLAALLCVAWLVWAWGLQGKARWVLSSLALAALLGLGSQVLLPAMREAPSDSASASASVPAQSAHWQAWSEARLQAELAAGRPVFVDFTAAWCVTCQYNKKTTLANAQVLADLDARQVVLLRADWTRRDAAITRALTALGRSGVPVYVLYAPGQAPVLLSELPSVAEVQQALRAL
ncbi:MAG: protein-disulfide reductase DsbD family protein [Limnohabitans sp.]